MSEPKKPIAELPPDFKGGWETDREKALHDLSFTPEKRLEILAELIEFSEHLRNAVLVVR